MFNRDVCFVQTDGKINNPHPHKKGDISMLWLHTDGYAVRNDGMDYSIAKIDSDDFEQGPVPNWRTYYG